MTRIKEGSSRKLFLLPDLPLDFGFLVVLTKAVRNQLEHIFAIEVPVGRQLLKAASDKKMWDKKIEEEPKGHFFVSHLFVI